MTTLDRAIAIAREAHAGQVDKAGRPYIEHVMRVVDAVEGEDAKVVAALHDVLEDHPKWTDEVHLIMPYNLLLDLALLRRSPKYAYSCYIDDLVQHGSQRARAVKIADLRDNADPARLALLPEKDRTRLAKKYAAALKTLGAD